MRYRLALIIPSGQGKTTLVRECQFKHVQDVDSDINWQQGSEANKALVAQDWETLHKIYKKYQCGRKIVLVSDRAAVRQGTILLGIIMPTKSKGLRYYEQTRAKLEDDNSVPKIEVKDYEHQNLYVRYANNRYEMAAIEEKQILEHSNNKCIKIIIWAALISATLGQSEGITMMIIVGTIIINKIWKGYIIDSVYKRAIEDIQRLWN